MAQSSYGQILKSSAVIGGSSAINIGLRIVRAKFMALLLGPQGVGLLGIYTAIHELASSVASMGIANSGVRQIAVAVGEKDPHRVACTVRVLRIATLGLGCLGAAAMILCSRPVSVFSFGDDLHTNRVALLSLAVLFSVVATGQAALLQGVRRIGDLAKRSVLGAFYGTVVSVAFVYLWGAHGVAPAIVASAALESLTSWWYSRRVAIEKVRLPARQAWGEGLALLRLGSVFMSVGVLTLGVAYLVRIVVVRSLGMDAAGYYQAAWTLGGLYVGFVLQAMGADFYPRLTSASQDKAACNRLVNEQIEVGLLLAVPGVLATLTLAPWVIRIFYASGFEPAIRVLQWFCLGMLLRVCSWPMGFVLFARSEKRLILGCELLSNLTHIALVWVGVKSVGLAGAGMAFLGMYLVYTIVIRTVVGVLTGFRLSPQNVRLLILFLPPAVALMLVAHVAPPAVTYALGLATSAAALWYSVRRIAAVVPPDRWPGPVKRMLAVFGLGAERHGT